MKNTTNNLRYVLVIVVAILVSGIFVSALATSIDDETYYGSATTASTIQVNGESAALTVSAERVIADDKIKEHGFLLAPLSETSVASVGDGPYIRQQVAIDAALKRIQAMTQAGADAVNVALVNFSDTETPFLPESNISLMNIPVWLVSFENIVVPRGNRDKTDQINADVNVVVDAYSGQVLEVFSYSAG